VAEIAKVVRFERVGGPEVLKIREEQILTPGISNRSG